MAAPMVTCRKCKYLLHFAHEHLDFRLAELKSVAGLFNIPVCVPTEGQLQNPFVVVDLPNEEAAKKIASRTILVKSLFELWAKGSTYEELFSDLRNLPKHFTDPYKNGSFCIRLTSFNKQISMVDKIKRIETLLDGNVSFDGKMNLKTPDNNFHLLEYYGANQVEPSEQPITIYFGRWIADGQRDNIKTYHLQNRKFIGNTSMDATLGFIMANMGQVKPHSLVFDPFVGTGSLLIAGAHHGAYVMGTDIDYKLLHSRGRSSRTGQKWRRPDENIYENLRQYNLAHRFLDCLVADASQHSLWRQQPLFDAIVTDPPYGIREATNRVGTTKESVKIAEEHKADHVPSKVNYHLSDILKDLLNFAAKYLTLHGRLTFWLPVYRPDYVDEHIPRHSCLHLVANSEQILNSKISRRLVTLEKVKEFEGELADQSATMPQDPYQGGTFREKYFTPNSKAPDERRVAKTTAARSACVAGETGGTTDGRRPTKTMRSQQQDDLSERSDVSMAASAASDT